ncbi:N-acetyltransferase family protein [bacterium]|nr:MAG: N-acetyltransferase family protein [bacterium]
MLIRFAHQSDLHQIDAIYNQAILAGELTADLKPWSPEKRLLWFGEHPSETHPIFVALEDDSIAGFLSVSPYRKGREALSKTVEISYYVDSTHRSKGIASKLLEEAETFCKAKAYKNIFAIILESNSPSIQLLKKFGYQQWGHLPNVAEFKGKEVGQVYFGKRIL